MYNMQSRGVTVPNAIIGMSCFVGGLAQFVAGMWGTSLTTFPLKVTIVDHMVQQSSLLAMYSARLVSAIF